MPVIHYDLLRFRLAFASGVIGHIDWPHARGIARERYGAADAGGCGRIHGSRFHL
jgi:hypothetical protein